VTTHVTANSTTAVITRKTMMEPNKITDSLKKAAGFIVGSFVALYTTAIDIASGSSQSIDAALTPIFSGAVNVAVKQYHCSSI